MKNIALIDRIVYSVAQVLTAFGLLMFLFLPMITVKVSVYGLSTTVSATLIDAMSQSSELSEAGINMEGDGSGVVFMVFFIIAMCIAALEILYIIITLITGKNVKFGAVIGLAAAATVVSLALFIICNIEIADALGELGEYASYFDVSTSWVGSLIVCAVSLVIPLIYGFAVKPRLSAAPIAETAEVSEPQVNATANDEMAIVETLKAYKQLLDDGAITQEEYDNKKKELFQ